MEKEICRKPFGTSSSSSYLLSRLLHNLPPRKRHGTARQTATQRQRPAILILIVWSLTLKVKDSNSNDKNGRLLFLLAVETDLNPPEFKFKRWSGCRCLHMMLLPCSRCRCWCRCHYFASNDFLNLNWLHHNRDRVAIILIHKKNKYTPNEVLDNNDRHDPSHYRHRQIR